MKRMIPELLSPVGGWAQLEAAVNNGADAVYMGGSLFNARINAENFTEETLAKAIDFAHEREVKVYITFNTLIRDSELARAFRYANYLYEIGADGLILQDMGLARLVHKYLPDFPIHLSTQGTVYNKEALELAAEFGFNRIVPARELSLGEIRSLSAATSMEIEVFVHGALCMCYSGQCQMSRAFGGGGRSGNRGLCAQPCRLLYTDDKGRKGYFLSPKDLCALELIPELIEAGVDSFKIEGRLKSPEYVAVTTAVYRKYLDLYASGAAASQEEWEALIDPEDMSRLRRIFNRGGFTHGYLEGNPGREILSGSSPKNQGVYIGAVSGAAIPVRNKGKTRDKVLVDVRLEDPGNDIIQGDGVEIRDKEFSSVASSNVVTYVEKRQKGVLRIGDFDKGIAAGDTVYKVTDKKLREEVLAAAQKKIPVSMRFEAYLRQKPTLEIGLRGEGKGMAVQGDFVVEKAIRKATTCDKITAQLTKLGDTPLCVYEKDIEIFKDEEIMIPLSVINQMRRDAAEAFLEAKRGELRSARAVLSDESINEIIEDEQLGDDRLVSAVGGTSRELVPLQEFMTDPAAQDAIPYILNVSKGELDEYIRAHFDEIAAAVRDTGILIGNLGWIRQFLNAGVPVYGDYGLNAYNGQSVKAYEELGVKMLYLSHESRPAKENGADPRFDGRVPLMITEHPLETDYLIDRKGVKHEIIRLNNKDVIL